MRIRPTRIAPVAPVYRLGAYGLAGCLLGLPGCGPRSLSEADRAAITTVLQDQAAAWNRGDLDGFMSGYSRERPDLVFTSGANIRRGYEDAYQLYKKSYSDGGRMGKLAFELLEVRELGAEAAVVLGRYVLTETDKAGDGVFSLVFVHESGGWKVVHDHTSATPAAENRSAPP